MEYYGCRPMEEFTLGISGNFDLPPEHEKNKTMLSLCCENGDVPGISFGQTAEETLERFLGLRNRIIVRGLDGVSNPFEDKNFPCAKCHRYIKKEWGYPLQISRVTFAMLPALCQCRCFYCVQAEGIYGGWEKNPDVISNYEKLFDFLHLAKKENLISPYALWDLASGEVTIHPYKKQMMKLSKGARVFFYTNGFIFDEDIAQELHENPQSMILISLDAGTAETWHKVKGVNNFRHVLDNLKKYSSVACSPKQIVVKYIIFPGINDSEEDFVFFVELEKRLHFTFGTISRNVYSFSDNETSDNTLAADRVFLSELIESAARFSAIRMKQNLPVSFSNFSRKEERQTLILANEILEYM